MSYSVNRKFTYLIDNVFHRFNNINVKSILDTIQSFKRPHIEKKIIIKSRLEKLYPRVSFMRKKNENTDFHDSELENINKIDTHKKKFLDKHTENKQGIERKSQDDQKIKIPISKPLQSTIRIDKKFKDTYSFLNIINNLESIEYDIIEIDKVNDYYSIAFFSALSTIFSLYNDNEKMECLKNIKTEVISKFQKEDFYKDFDYSTKDFKKSNLDDTFCLNKNVTMSMLKVYSDVLNINCVHIYDNNITFLTKYKLDNATVLLEETNNKIYTILAKHSFVRGNDCAKELGVYSKYSKSTLEKFKLDKLQNMARMYNMDIKKKGKVGKVNLKKEELINLMSID